MKKIAFVAALMASQVVMADGFTCVNEAGDLKVKVFNSTDASVGTRSGSVMVLSNPEVSYGRKTIARFTAVNKTMASHELTYTAKVDLRFNDSAAKGENVGGTKLGQLDLIILSVDFTYADPVSHGEVLAGAVTLIKRNGAESIEDLVCQRYLKN